MSSQDKVIVQVLRSADVVSGSTSDVGRHFGGNSYPKLPEADVLELGEIALNIAKGYEVIAIKNYDGEIVYLPFNVAARLLDVEVGLDDLRDYTIESVEILSGVSISLYDNIEHFKVEIRREIVEAITGLSGYTAEAIERLSGETDTKINDVNAKIDGEVSNLNDKIRLVEESLTQNFSQQINQLSADTQTRINQLSGDTYNKIDQLSGYTVNKIDELSADTQNKISQLSGDTENKINQLDYKVRSEINELSADTENKISYLSGETDNKISQLSAYTDSQINQLSGETEGKISHLSADTENEINQLSGETNNKIDSVSATTRNEFDELNSEIDNRFEELSATTESEISRLTSDTQEKIDSFSADTQHKFAQMSTDTQEKINQLSAETKSGISQLSADTQNQINALSGEVESLSSLEGRVDELDNCCAKVKEATGLDENIEYKPQLPELSGMTMTEAIDHICTEVNDVSGSTKDFQENLEEVELVHAGAFARLNHSLGFDKNAEFWPDSGTTIYGMNVTEAIDYLYQWTEEIVNYLGTEEWSLLIRSLPYENLVILRNQKMLRSGIWYRITNYQACVKSGYSGVEPRTEVVPSGYKTSMGFDILMRATSNKTLDENVRFVLSDNRGDFNRNHIETWQGKYSLDNDQNRFDWASPDGFGVIYYLKDEYGNEAPYDFKNLKINGKYTFHDSESSYSYDLTLKGKARGNVIKPYHTSGSYAAVQSINRCVFVGSEFVGNTMAAQTTNITCQGSFYDCQISSEVSGLTIDGTTTPRIGELIGYAIPQS